MEEVSTHFASTIASTRDTGQVASHKSQFKGTHPTTILQSHYSPVCAPNHATGAIGGRPSHTHQDWIMSPEPLEAGCHTHTGIRIMPPKAVGRALPDGEEAGGHTHTHRGRITPLSVAHPLMHTPSGGVGGGVGVGVYARACVIP